jgi:small subunit ribosomal protein S18
MSEENAQQDSLVRTANRNAKKSFFRRRSGCPLCVKGADIVDYKNPDLLKKFTSENGRILPSRIISTCASHQRRLKESVKVARMIALLPF